MTYDACSCDFDGPSVCHVKTVKARKEYRCEECRATIAIGERYENTWGVWEGEGNTFRTCLLCAELRQWARISVPCFCWMYGELHDNVRDLVHEARGDCPQGWVMEWGRRMVAIERKKLGQHWPRQWQRRRPPRSALEIVQQSV